MKIIEKSVLSSDKTHYLKGKVYLPEGEIKGYFQIMGTGGKNPLADVALTLIKIMKKAKGERHVSKFLDKMAFGSYNNNFKAENNRRSWLTTDSKIWEKYDADPFCNYRFTLSAMHDLISLNKYSNVKAWYDKIDSKLPLLLVSGDQDPVGENGKAVTKVYETLVSKGRLRCK